MTDESLESILASINSPLGNVYHSTVERTLSQASQDGATNLLIKAERAIAVGDRPRADRLVARALALPYDTFEQSVPTAVSAEMMLFNLVSDEAETADEGDESWLDAALNVLDRRPGAAGADLQHILDVIEKDYLLAPSERRRIRQALRDRVEQVELRELPDGAADLAQRVMGVLELCVAYKKATLLDGDRQV